MISMLDENRAWPNIPCAVWVLRILALPHSPPQVDRMWDIWGSYYNIDEAIFYLLKGDYSIKCFHCGIFTSRGTVNSGAGVWIIFGGGD